METRKERKQLAGKNCLVLGLGKSGTSAAQVLQRSGANVMVNDRHPREKNEKAVVALERQGIDVVCGGHPLSLLDQPLDLIVKNPGIPYDIPFLQEAEKRNIPIVTEIEIAYMITKAPIIGVTGSNGKTTTTTLIYEMLQDERHEPLVAGNIGTVLCEVAETARKEQIIIAELSSFQLLGSEQFCPHIGLWLNLFEAHLDYHHTLEHYASSKAKLFANQTIEHIGVFNYDQPLIRDMAAHVKSQRSWFSMEGEVERGTYVEQGKVKYKSASGDVQTILAVDEIVLPGEHNLQNVLAAVCVCMEKGAKLNRIRSVLRSFSGVKHRLEFIRELSGVKYYNDSKATNVLATQKALQSFSEPVILIAGGLDRGTSFTELIPLLSTRVRVLIAYGQVASNLQEVAEKAGVKQIVRVDTVKEAVRSAHEQARSGEVVLLSPAAASWDQFTSFEERGDMFTQCVHMLR